MSAPVAVERLPRVPCPDCGARVILVEDVDTLEPILVEPAPADGGQIVVWALNLKAFARRYGKPARVQPAWREHDCPTPAAVAPPPDPYTDESPAAQQHGGWRAS